MEWLLCWCHLFEQIISGVWSKNGPFWRKATGWESHLRHKWYDWCGTQISLRDWCRCTFIFLGCEITIFPNDEQTVVTRWVWFAPASWTSEKKKSLLNISNLKSPKFIDSLRNQSLQLGVTELVHTTESLHGRSMGENSYPWNEQLVPPKWWLPIGISKLPGVDFSRVLNVRFREGFHDGAMVGKTYGEAEFSCAKGWCVHRNDAQYSPTSARTRRRFNDVGGGVATKRF